jgi:hypothetical protein
MANVVLWLFRHHMSTGRVRSDDIVLCWGSSGEIGGWKKVVRSCEGK